MRKKPGLFMVLFLIVFRIVLSPLAILLSLWLLTRIDKLSLDLPLFRWVTLDEVIAFGYSRTSCKILLPVMHRIKRVEIRVRTKISEDELKKVTLYRAARTYFNTNTD